MQIYNLELKISYGGKNKQYIKIFKNCNFENRV